MNSITTPLPACLPLRNAQQFQAVLKQGQIAARSAHFVLHVLRWPVGAKTTPAPAAPTQPQLLFACGRKTYLGAIIPKRWARRAVTRNLIKRQIRSVMAQSAASVNAQMPDNIAIVVRLRTAFNPQHFISASSPVLRAAVRTELCQLLAHPDWVCLPTLPTPLHKSGSPKKTQSQIAARHAPAPSGTMPVLP